MKHFDADGACLLSLRASWCADSCASSDEGGVIYWHWQYCDCDRASDVRGAWVGCLRASALYSIRISVHQDGRVWASIYRICNFFTIVGLQATGLDDVRVHLDIPWPGGQAGSSINEFLWN